MVEYNDVATIDDLANAQSPDPWDGIPNHSEGCQLCGHIYGQKHRIRPGAWGGTYEEEGNVVRLCPNHHASIHLFMKWYYLGAEKLTEDQGKRMEVYFTDRPLKLFWLRFVRPVVIERLKLEGRWHPYRRQVEEKEIRKRI